jgi:hypothetical protein
MCECDLLNNIVSNGNIEYIMGAIKGLLDNNYEIYINNINDGEVFITKIYRNNELLQYIEDRDYIVDYIGVINNNLKIVYNCY